MEKNKWYMVSSSSLISGYKYDGENFTVEFKSNGAMYIYYAVPGLIVNNIPEEGQGSYIKHNIIDGGYSCKRVN